METMETMKKDITGKGSRPSIAIKNTQATIAGFFDDDAFDACQGFKGQQEEKPEGFKNNPKRIVSTSLDFF